MDWKTFFILLAKAALRVLADELDPANRRRRPHEEAPTPKEAPQPRPREPQQAEQSAASAGWSAPTEPPPVTVIRIETDHGATISPISFVGDQGFGRTRVERERGPGESRRVRRKARAEEVTPGPREPWMDAFAERARAEARETVARREEAQAEAMSRLPPRSPEMQACIERMRARASGATLATLERPTTPPRQRQVSVEQ